MTLPQDAFELFLHSAYRITVALKANYFNANSISTRLAGQLTSSACDWCAGGSQFKSR
jgi:hypothetical protein